MTENKVKKVQKGDIIVFEYDYFSLVHTDNRKGIITDSDYLTFDKQQLLYFFNISKIQLLQNVKRNIANNYGNLNKEEIENIFNWIKYMILNDRFYDDDNDNDDLFRYRDIKEYVLIDCIPEKRFYSSIQWKNSL